MGQFYSKINTIFKRDLDKNSPLYNCILLNEPLTQPEFEALRKVKWECTEKIDGTNMSVCITPLVNTDGECSVEYHGKTENANTPNHLQKKMEALFPKDKVVEYFKANSKDGVIADTIQVFGEGYGVKIQKGGNYISNDCGFILFDVKIGKYWLTREACEKIAEDLGVPIVPLMGYMDIDEAIEFVRKGFKSTIAENKDYDAEGLVLKAPCGILARNGERIITKIKTCDFRQLEAKIK